MCMCMFLVLRDCNLPHNPALRVITARPVWMQLSIKVDNM